MTDTTRSGIKFICASPEDEIIVGMVEFRGKIIVATDKNIYELIDDKLDVIRFQEPAP
jgi:predicted RNase H-like nuclease (RuvC/YqgF family)